MEEDFKERRFRQPLGIRISKCFFINSHLNDFRLPSSALRPPRPFL